MTASKQIDLLIHNVGPHESLSLSFRPGVSILKGRNGIGKSTAIAATAAAMGGDGSVSVLDGKLKGTVSVDGVLVLQIGKTVNRKGQPSVEIGSFSAISDMIDPGVQDPVKADARRVKAILSMAPVPLTPEVVLALTSGNKTLLEKPPPEDAPNILAVAEHFRRAANDLALAEEVKEKVAKSRAAGDSAALAEMPVAVSSLTLVDADAEVAKADRKLSQVSLLAAQREEMVARHERIRATLGEMPDEYVFKTAVEVAVEKARSARLEVKEAEEALAEAKKEEALADAEVVGARKALATVSESILKWKYQAAALQEPITGPALADVEAAQ